MANKRKSGLVTDGSLVFGSPEEPADAKAKLLALTARLEPSRATGLHCFERDESQAKRDCEAAANALRVFIEPHCFDYFAYDHGRTCTECGGTEWPCPVLEKAAEGL